MGWASVIDNPLLRNLPFKIELNRFGQLLMSPASNRHGRTQSRIVVALARRRQDGEIIPRLLAANRKLDHRQPATAVDVPGGSAPTPQADLCLRHTGSTSSPKSQKSDCRDGVSISARGFTPVRDSANAA